MNLLGRFLAYSDGATGSGVRISKDFSPQEHSGKAERGEIGGFSAQPKRSCENGLCHEEKGRVFPPKDANEFLDVANFHRNRVLQAFEKCRPE